MKLCQLWGGWCVRFLIYSYLLTCLLGGSLNSYGCVIISSEESFELDGKKIDPISKFLNAKSETG